MGVERKKFYELQVTIIVLVVGLLSAQKNQTDTESLETPLRQWELENICRQEREVVGFGSVFLANSLTA
jgi:hypothetical protein